MVKKSLLAVLMVSALAGCSDPDSEWLNNGNLSGLDRQGWAEASPAKQLGTAGFWLRSLQNKGFLNDSALTEGAAFKQNAQMLVDCLNSSIVVSTAETNYLTATCVSTMGWAADK